MIVGSGPAGYTAALYAARANLDPLVIEGWAWGGLLQQTTDVENYPGFPEGIMGPELMQHLRDQAERFGARLETDEVTAVEFAPEGGLHRVYVGEDVHSTRSVILAMGAKHRKLGVAGEEELSGRGVSYCATCDAAFFRDVPTLIVGGGDSAMEEAMFLAKFASKVAIVHRRDEFRASRIMLERARALPNIEWLTPYAVEEFVRGSGGSLAVARLRNTVDDSTRDLEIGGAFIAVGHEPQSQLVTGQVELDATATWSPRDVRPRPGCPACSLPATSSTTPTGRRSPPPAQAARLRSTPSGTCATTRRPQRAPTTHSRRSDRGVSSRPSLRGPSRCSLRPPTRRSRTRGSALRSWQPWEKSLSATIADDHCRADRSSREQPAGDVHLTAGA